MRGGKEGSGEEKKGGGFVEVGVGMVGGCKRTGQGWKLEHK